MHRFSSGSRHLRLVFAALLGSLAAPAIAAPCGTDLNPVSTELPYGTGWGVDERNTRYQTRSNLNAANADKLTLKWSYGLASNTPRSYPLVTENTVFLGDGGRGVVALDRESGCERWLFAHEGAISTAIVGAELAGRRVLLFGDRTQGIYLLDALSGELIWHAMVEDQPLPWYSGSPVVAGDTVYVPVSSMEVAVAVNPLYGCCTTRGGLAAFDLATGSKRWFRPTIDEPAAPTGRHWLFVQKYGPSGATVWGTPSYDAARALVYFGTGQNYSHPTTDTSDAIFAVSAADGAVAWVTQFTADDAYTAACNIEALNHPNCPDPMGPDVDFGAPTMLVRTPQGRELLIAGQKSAEAHALDPATGEVVWTQRLGRGGIIGGVHWGIAANESLGLVYVPISDKKIFGFPSPGEPNPGLYALDVNTGDRRWHYYRESRCEAQECVYGLSAAITAANDVVVTGSMDGYLELVHAGTGELLWSYDAWRDFATVNGVPAVGGGFDAHGAYLADDLLLVSAGYAYVGQQRGGNAFLVFEVADGN